MTYGLRSALTVLLGLGVLGAARADIVYYLDSASKKEQEHRGTIEEESPAGVKVKLRDGKVHQVPAGAITWVFYEGEIDRLTYRAPFAKEERARGESAGKRRTGFLNEALEGFTKLEQALASKPAARRYMQFKMAEVTALQAQDDPARTEQAVKLLNDFKTNHASSWQILPALKTLARLYEEGGKVEEARKTYEELAELPDAPAEMKQESAVLVGRLLLRGGKFAEAEKRLDRVAGTLSAGDPRALFVKAYLAESRLGQNRLAEAVKDLEEVVKASSDGRLRGLAYNLLGDYYQKKGQAEEAFWQYLRVDALYNDDPEQQARALYHLAKLFDKIKKDPIRGKECVERLLEQRFAGTTYQKQITQEVKKPATKSE